MQPQSLGYRVYACKSVRINRLCYYLMFFYCAKVVELGGGGCILCTSGWSSQNLAGLFISSTGRLNSTSMFIFYSFVSITRFCWFQIIKNARLQKYWCTSSVRQGKEKEVVGMQTASENNSFTEWEKGIRWPECLATQ